MSLLIPSPRRLWRALLWPLIALFYGAWLSAAPVVPTNSPWSVRAWKSDEGLPNNYVTGLVQLADGYLWVGTYSSPARFDGVRFDEYSPRDFAGSVNQKISALERSQRGGLWLGSLHGVVFHLSTQGVEVFDTRTDKEIQSMIEDRDGALWIAYRGGLVSRLRGGAVQRFSREHGLSDTDRPERYVCDLTRDRHGRLWFAKDGHVGLFRGGRFESLLQVRPVTSRIAGAASGGVWVCNDQKLLRFVEGRPAEDHGTLDSRSGGLTEPTALFEDRQGGVWIGTSDRGLFHYDGNQIKPVPTSGLQITRIAQDSEGNVWVGTMSDGLNRVCPRVVSLETAETGLPASTVQSVCEDSEGRVWVTGQNGALVRRDGSGWVSMTEDPTWPGGRASCVVADPRGGVWIGTRDRALHRWDNGVFTSWRRGDGLAAREIHGLLVDRAGDVWLGQISPDSVQRLRKGSLQTLTLPGRIRIIRAMAEDAAGQIWFGTSGGNLLRVEGDTVVDETSRITGEPFSIRALHATPDGGLWIGFADEGMGWLKDGRFILLTAKHGFPESNLSQIITDPQGWLWFAGDHGIYRVGQRELEELATGVRAKAHFVRYGLNEGLLSLEANRGDHPSVARTRDGRLWLPMRTGLAVIDPARRRPHVEPPPVLLKSVERDNTLLASHSSVVPMRPGVINLAASSPEPGAVHLPPAHHRLTFHFTALSFDAPENVRFRYRLDGYDAHWVEAGADRSASYSRLDAGRYRFLVQACNSDGIWNEKGAAFAFTVKPFVWHTWWFRLLALLAFTTLTAAIVRYISLRRVRQKVTALEQQAALHKERTRIARDLHDEFGTRLTELGLIAELEYKQLPAGHRSSGSPDLVKHIRSLEQDLDAIVWSVNPKNDTVSHLVGFICRFAGEFLGRSGIRCRFDIPDDMPSDPLIPEVRHNLFMVVREAVNNVVKHAGANEAKLRVRLEGGRFHFCLEDNGRGFSVEAAEASVRNGLKNMRARIEELGGTYAIESTAGQGTVLQFTLPLAPPVTSAGLSASYPAKPLSP